MTIPFRTGGVFIPLGVDTGTGPLDGMAGDQRAPSRGSLRTRTTT
ncbi:hypothetical protein [Streptomyces sp. NPDC058613]